MASTKKPLTERTAAAFAAILAFSVSSCQAWVPSSARPGTSSSAASGIETMAVPGRSFTRLSMVGAIHGQNSCFLPLQQLDQDYYSPRIVQIAGAYPGLTADEFLAVTSEPAPEIGQWTYDFSDPDGPQVGTVAIQGSEIVNSAEDPVVVIAEHFSIGVELPAEVVDPVDLIVLVDRAKNGFKERTFLVIDEGTGQLSIGAFGTKSELPEGCKIMGHVLVVQIPFLPSMKSTKSGFMEADEYF